VTKNPIAAATGWLEVSADANTPIPQHAAARAASPRNPATTTPLSGSPHHETSRTERRDGAITSQQTTVAASHLPATSFHGGRPATVSSSSVPDRASSAIDRIVVRAATAKSRKPAMGNSGCTTAWPRPTSWST
jgi:hypothetical protein